MKYIYLLILLLISSVGFSQTKGITYQAVILNPIETELPGVNQTNAPLANAAVCLKFGILDQNSDIEYLETIQTTTDKFGMVNLIIGTGSQIGGYASTFSDVVWGNNAKNLQVHLNAEGNCSSYTEISNQPFTYVPFALNALNENKKLIDGTIFLGDANGDGTRDANEDEFIEFYNSGLEIDISGYTITDNRPADGEQLRHTFPSGSIIPADGVLVLFGGGNPSGDFGNSVVQTASEGMLNMNNTGDLVTMYDTCGDVILTFDVETLSNNPNESYTRSPDITGETFEQHAGIASSNGALFSPGYKLDGTDF